MNTETKVSEIQVIYHPCKMYEATLTTSSDVIAILRTVWDEGRIEMQEEVKVLLVNSSNAVIGVYNLSKGGITASLVDIRLILSVALKCLATGLILVHNHPSGNLNPSSADLSIVKKLKTACKLLDISLLDSIIITKESYTSFNDEGLL
ncbi:DNA repair protein [Chryseobacterium lactis]|uniref:DNA repair protein n=1 Tax=Chryseobacterium lactis TaxID=1241981 RepID=A0A3G6RZ19_CHRLC|nr:JAB domain-containing protein [Chryseobacterium lactis]AZA85115.1 DNA repair protein [Chryseobacterium lactis]AZB07066.1 DNA repair protein [Chryseobacterium lactis]PNW14306.1 DNA repair protein [Chryseobacterium lactis]